MSSFVAELVGTMIVVLLGDGVVANVTLAKTKGHGGGWIVIATGWGLAVALAVYAAGGPSGGHFNPAFTVAVAALGTFDPKLIPMYLTAQILGGFLGGCLVWLAYRPHFEATEDPAAKLGVFATIPAIRRPVANAITEVIGTAFLVTAILAVASPENLTPGSDIARGLKPLLVGLIVFAIGLSLGGPTGYAINPARDLGPRLAHYLLPIPGKGSSEWSYAWIPIAAPLVGGLLGALVYRSFWS